MYLYPPPVGAYSMIGARRQRRHGREGKIWGNEDIDNDDRIL